MECLVPLYIWVSPYRTPQVKVEINNKDLKLEINMVAV